MKNSKDLTRDELVDEIERLEAENAGLRADGSGGGPWGGFSTASDLLEGIFSVPHMLIACMDRDFNFIRVNRAYSEADGREDPGWYVGRNHFELFPNDENEAIFRRVVETGEAHTSYAKPFEYALNPERGVTHWDWTLQPMKDPKAGVAGVVLMLTDVTGHIRREEELGAYRMLFDNIPDIAFILDRDGSVVYINDAVERFSGRAAGNFLGKATFEEVLDPENHARAMRSIGKTLAGEDVAAEVVFRDTGSVCEFRAIPLVKDGETVGLMGIGRDITERRRLEAELQRVERLDSLGVLAGGIAHDFNNLLTGITGNISVALARTGPEDGNRAALGSAQKAAFLARDLTRQLLTFSRGGSPVTKVVSLEGLVKDCCGFAMSGSSAACDCDAPEGLWPAEVDYGQISQVVNNLVINAHQASKEGGRVKVTARNVEVGPDEEGPLEPGRYVSLMVRDSGPGIPPEVAERIFDPFYTTKEGGSGLGLAVAHSIVKGHRGHISVESPPGGGTAFHVYLPAAEGEAEEGPEPEGMELGRGDGLSVLVMDDDDMVLDVAAEMLRSLGYGAATAPDGEAAVRAYEEALGRGEPFDAVIMDLTVPGAVGGREAVRRLLEVDPGARVIVSSGYSEDDVLADHERYGFRGVIKKPYRMEEFAKVLSRVLRGDGGDGQKGRE